MREEQSMDPIRTLRGALERYRELFAKDHPQYVRDMGEAPLSGAALASLGQVARVVEAANEAHRILQYNLGDVDPHVRSACDILWAALEPFDE
jgi:hypothetical protein